MAEGIGLPLSAPVGPLTKAPLKGALPGQTADPVDATGIPSIEQKLFLVVSVALATVCFFTNIVQVGVFVRPLALRSVKNLLLLSQAASGVVASFVAAFPIHVISARGGSVIGDSGYNACYLGHSGVILLSLLTSLSTATLLLLYHFLTSNHPRKYSAVGSSLGIWGVALTGVWAYSMGIALLPWAGWNSWAEHDSRCHLSTLWPLSFTAFLTFLVGVHSAAALAMWSSARAAHLKTIEDARRAGRTTLGIADSESAPITPTVVRGSGDGCSVGLCGWAMSVSSLVPLVGHVLVASSCAASPQCLSSPRHYHEDESSLPWSSLLLTAAAIANPLLYVFSDDQVSSTTLLLLTRACCWWRRGSRVQSRTTKKRTPSLHGPSPQGEVSLETETNAYVTNDTDQLVGREN